MEINQPVIGIVGGTGPFAGMDLMARILKHTEASSDQDHIPTILYSNTRISDRTDFLESPDMENPSKSIAETLSSLVLAGATVAGIACNTAHADLIFDEVMTRVENEPIKVLHMIDEVVAVLASKYPKGTKIGVLCATGAYAHDVYFSRLRKSGFVLTLPGKEFNHEYIHKTIYDTDFGIKTQGGVITATACKRIQTAVDWHVDAGAEVLLLGCTELPLLLHCLDFQGKDVYNSNDVLAMALIRESYPERLIVK